MRSTQRWETRRIGKALASTFMAVMLFSGMSTSFMRSAQASWVNDLNLSWFCTMSTLGSAGTAALPTFQLTFKPDGKFEPARLIVPAGRFKIELRNESQDPVEFESIPLRKEKVLAPGATSFVVITVSRPGEYPFFDDFHPDVQGTLVVQAKN